MLLIASVKPRDEPQRPDGQVVAEAESIIVRALFDDIVRQLAITVAAREPESGSPSALPDEAGDGSSVWIPSPRVHPGRSRSPPQK
jgi:hypothetical protein